MNIPQEIINDCAEKMSKDIDTEIVMSALGWMSFELSEGTVYGKKYMTVHPSNTYDWNELMAWMEHSFGPTAHDGVWTPGMRWYANNAKFWFRNKKDLEWFLLRWS